MHNTASIAFYKVHLYIVYVSRHARVTFSWHANHLYLTSREVKYVVYTIHDIMVHRYGCVLRHTNVEYMPSHCIEMPTFL